MYKGLLLSTLVVFSASTALAAGAPRTDEQKTLYAVGLAVSKTLAVFDLSAEELELVQQGIADAVTGKKTAVELSDFNPKVQEMARTRRQALGARQAAAGKEFIEQAAKEKGAVRTGSGVVYLALTEGKGTAPASNDTVQVHYRGTLVDGREFDSSHKRGKPLEFKLDNVIKCWTEGVQKMKVGGKARLVCPSEMAYGQSGVGEMIMPGATLAFEVELLDVKRATTPPAPVTLPRAKAAEAPAAAQPSAGPLLAAQPAPKAAP